MKIFSWILVLCVVWTNYTFASTPKFRTYTTIADFERGELKGVSLTSSGEIQLAPALKKLHESTEPAIWDVVVNSKGIIYFPVGNEGKIFQIDNSGKAKELCQLDEVEVYCLALDSQNRLYAGSSPDGKVYQIDATGKATMFFDPSDRYIWDILFDAQNNMYVATGDSGNIYKITPDKKTSIFYKSDEQHIRCLAWDNQHQLLAGSYGNGYVYRISKSGEGFVIYDSNLKEIHHIEVTKDGTIYAGALGKDFAGPAQPVIQKKAAPAQQQNNDNDEGNNGGDELIIGEIQIEVPRAQPSGAAVSESAILKISPNGSVKNVWDSFNEHVQSFVLSKNQYLIVGTGNEAKLVLINAAEEKTILHDLEESQISALAFNPQNQLIIATANMGNLYSLQSNYQKSGEYISEVFDSYMPTRWGSISWKQDVSTGGAVQLYTRSGNTETPNSTWSAWSAAYTNPDAENILSPDARFIQWKAMLKNGGQKTPQLKEVTVAYLSNNIPPDIIYFTIYPAGDYYQGADQNISLDDANQNNDDNSASNARRNKSYLGRKSFRQGYQSISWDIDDQNGDQLTHNIYYRCEDESNWKKLASNWYTTAFSWDTQRFPDGVYFLKLVATDSLSNPASIAASSEKISDSFIIDNSGPVIQFSKPTVRSKSVQIKFTVQDAYTPLLDASYAYNGQEWKPIFPDDGISDSRQEHFTIDLDISSNGNQTLVIKATDQLKNIGFNQIRFED
ncbi:hypothetical protein JW960_05660 [candidate division KSB1 bacterium]|nr:hypothetical protein [candidate division KSB1 bacterium]